MTRAVLTASPLFVDLALNEVRRHHLEVTTLQHLAPGYIFLQIPDSFDKLTLPGDTNCRFTSTTYFQFMLFNR